MIPPVPPGLGQSLLKGLAVALTVYALVRTAAWAWFTEKEAHLKRLHRDWCGPTPPEEESE